MNISLSDSRFFYMDTTNISSSKQSGLKQLLKHDVPLSNWIGCGNHEVALFSKHPLNVFPDVLSADATLLALWKFFHCRPLAINFLLKNAADAYEEYHVTPVSPSLTRWTAHEIACKSLCDGYRQILSALSACVNERKEPNALGIFQGISSKILGYFSNVAWCICCHSAFKSSFSESWWFTLPRWHACVSSENI